MEFYGVPSPWTIRGIVVTVDGVIQGFGGVSRDPGETHRFFSDYKDGLTPHLKSITVLRAIKAGMKMVKEYPGVVMGVAQHDAGAELMLRLGFVHVEGDAYAWLGSH